MFVTNFTNKFFNTLEAKMFVGERMSHPVITVAPETPIHDVVVMFKKEHIRRAPVVSNGKLIGIVTENDLLNASPSPVTSLSVWEMNYLISKVKLPAVYGQDSGFLQHAQGDYDALHAYVESQVRGLELAKTYLKVR